MSRTRTRDRFVEGTRIGDYVIEQELSFEEIGMVYLGKHVVLPRQAEIKVMHAGESWLRAKAVQMLREACLLEALSHPGIPRVYECGVLGDKRPWTAFEHVDGTSVGARIASGPMPLVDVLVFVRDVTEILDHIHRRGIVHRRLTAEAIVQTPKRRFPLCIRQWGDACTLDSEGHITLDPRDDVHELGVIAFRALTGAMPDLGSTAQDRYPGAPVDVTRMIDAMLAIDPADRPKSGDVRDRVRAQLDSLGHPKVEAAPRLATREIQKIEDPTAGFSIRISGGRPRSS